ncbi:MAG: non-specific endonuclease, partial [Phycisphaerales bacterium]|nr:non-specific endonuclease [Phycisphaerales bacterium]
MSNDSRNAHFASNSRRNILGAAITPLLETLEGRSLFTANALPTAIAGGPYSVNEGSSVLISGLSSTDSDGTVASYQWDTNYSASKGFKNRLSGGTYTFTADDSGTRQIALRVVDNNGAISPVSTATINIADVAPTITLTAPTTADEASPVAIAWSHTDPGLSDTVTAWDIDWGDDTSSTYAGTATAATHTYDENGSYTMTLTATQADATTSLTHAITVNNVTPIVNITTPYATIDEGEMAQIGFTSPNRGGTLDGWAIDWGDGQTEALSASRSVAAHFYTDSGNYTATVTAQEPDGGSGSSTIALTVNNVAATITQTGVPSTGTEGTSITVGSTVTDPGQDDTHTYGWTVYRNGTQFSLPGGTTLNASSFTFTPTDNGSYVTRLSVMDDEGAVATVNSTAIIVGNVNPTASITGTPVGSINEGDLVSLTAVPADVGSEDTFSYTWSVTKDSATFALPFATATSNATFNFTPTDDGSYVATVIVADDDLGTVSVSTTAITVDNVAPTATVTGEPSSSPEGTAITLGAHPLDAGTADTFTYSWSVEKDGNPYNVGVSPINQAAFTFTPTDNGDYVATVIVTDDDGDFVSTSSATIPVTNVAPTATILGDTAGDEGSGLNFSVAPADVGALDTTFTHAWSVTKGGNSYVTNLGATNTSNFTFTPVDDGAYAVTVVTTDKDGDSVSKSVNVTVANVKPVAAITGAPSTSPEATQISLGSTVTDAGVNDTFSYAWSVAKGSNAYNVGNAVTTNSTFAFTPGDNGTYVVTLVVTDNGGQTRTISTSAITVTNVNPTVSVSGEPVAPITEGGQVDLAAAGADVSSTDTLSYAWTITKGGSTYTPPSGTVLNNANLSFVPTDNGSYVATVVVTDDDTGTATASSTTILVINADPVATITGAPASSLEGSELNLNASVADDGVDDTHTYDWTVTKDSVPVDLTGIISDAAAFTYTPADNGDYVISLTVTDNDNGTSVTSANLTVTNVAPAPVISGNNSVNEDAPITLTVAANDPGTADTQTYLWSVTKGGNAYTTNLGATNTSSFTFTPNVQGTYVVSCVVTDKDAAHMTATKTITVNNIAPVAAITGMPTGPRGEGSPITLHGSATDASGETGLTYAWTVKRGGVSFALPGGTVTNAHDFEFTPTDNGLYRVTLAVTDSGGLIGTSTTSNMVVTNALPDAALSGEPSGAIDEGTPVSLHVDAADPGSEDTLSYLWSVTKDGSPFALPNGTATTGTNFTFTPTNQGTYIAKVVVTDDDGGPANVSTAGIVVNNVIPVAAITGEPMTSVGEGSTISLGSTATDPGTADTLTYSWSVEKDGSLFELPNTLNTAGSSFSFVPSDEGSYVVSLVVSDGTDIVTTSTDVISVDNVAPTGTMSLPASGIEGSPLTLTVAAADAGVNDTLTYAWSVTQDGNPVTLDSDVATDGTSFTYTPNNNGSYEFSCDVADGTSITTLSQTVAVANADPAVSLTDVPTTGAEGTAITVGSTASDVPADTLSYGWSVYRDGELYSLDSDVVTNGTSLTFTPSDDGSYVVRLSVTDGDTG